LQDAYTTLENNCAEQTARLEEFSSEIYTENARLRTELDTLQTTLDELQPKSAQNQVDTQVNTSLCRIYPFYISKIHDLIGPKHSNRPSSRRKAYSR
jgi:regulator of replication initiation timing